MSEYDIVLSKKATLMYDVPLSIKKYYHYRSLDNFLIHLGGLRGSDREQVLDLLNEYLECVENEPVIDKITSHDLFNRYFIPIGRIYERNLGFTPLVFEGVILFWLTLGCFFVYLFGAHWVFYIIVIAPLFFYYLYMLNKKKEKKVYGFMW